MGTEFENLNNLCQLVINDLKVGSKCVCFMFLEYSMLLGKFAKSRDQVGHTTEQHGRLPHKLCRLSANG